MVPVKSFADLGAPIDRHRWKLDGFEHHDGLFLLTQSICESKEVGAAIGLALTSAIAVDENGGIVGGDKIMYIIGSYHKRDLLEKYDRHNNRHVQSPSRRGVQKIQKEMRLLETVMWWRNAQVTVTILVVNNHRSRSHHGLQHNWWWSINRSSII